VPQARWAEYQDAVHAWQEAGSPRHPPIFSRYMDSERADYRRRAAYGNLQLIRQKEASWKKLLTAFLNELRSGRYLAVGRPDSPNVEPIPILSNSWNYVTRQNWNRSLVVIVGKQPTHFYDVRIFPAPEQATKKRRDSKISAQTHCEDWLTELMGENLKRRPKPRGDFLLEAQRQFKGLSARSFDIAWRNAVAKTRSNWSDAGRPEKSPRPCAACDHRNFGTG